MYLHVRMQVGSGGCECDPGLMVIAELGVHEKVRVEKYIIILLSCNECTLECLLSEECTVGYYITKPVTTCTLKLPW